MNLSTEISNDEMKPVVTEKSQSECRHENKFIARFWIFLTVRIMMQGTKPTFFQEIGLSLIESFQLRS